MCVERGRGGRQASRPAGRQADVDTHGHTGPQTQQAAFIPCSQYALSNQRMPHIKQYATVMEENFCSFPVRVHTPYAHTATPSRRGASGSRLPLSHTHSLTLSHSLTLLLSDVTRVISLSLSLSLSLSRTRTRTNTHIESNSFSTLCVRRPVVSHTNNTHHTHTHTHTHTQQLSLQQTCPSLPPLPTPPLSHAFCLSRQITRI